MSRLANLISRLKVVPPAGWGRLGWELAVVTVGVLIALSAQQLVDALRESKDPEFIESALRDELGLNAMMAFERLVIEDCLRDRIALLAARVREDNSEWHGDTTIVNSDTYRAFAMPGVYRTPNRQWSRAAWDTAVASGVLSKMGPERATQFAFIYSQLLELSQHQQEESLLAPKLTFLAYDQPMDAIMRREALTALGAVDASNRLMVLLSGQYLERVRDLQLDIDVKVLGGPAMNGAHGPKGVIDAQKVYRGACVKDLSLQL